MNNLGDLEIFARVVSAGSMSAAGRELGLSPAVVSKRLRRLEDRLGTRLMQRTTRQISLTEAGQGFYERVVAILAGIEEAEAFVSRRSALARGVLKVSAPDILRAHAHSTAHQCLHAAQIRISASISDAS
jgi:DNA-binding transcriptional LysR family regulator